MVNIGNISVTIGFLAQTGGLTLRGRHNNNWEK